MTRWSTHETRPQVDRQQEHKAVGSRLSGPAGIRVPGKVWDTPGPHWGLEAPHWGQVLDPYWWRQEPQE